MAVNCFRFFGMTSWFEIDQLTLKQYRIMMKALELKQIDEEFYAHRQAFLNQTVKAEKQVGKNSRPVYDSFIKFYDYEARIKKTLGEAIEQEPSQKVQSLEDRVAEFYKKKRKGGEK